MVPSKIRSARAHRDQRGLRLELLWAVVDDVLAIIYRVSAIENGLSKGIT